MNYHKTLDTLSIYDFKSIFKDQNKLHQIIVDYDDYTNKEKKSYISNHRKEILTTFEQLQEDFSRITFSKQELQREKEKAKMTYLIGKKEILLSALIVFVETQEPEALLVLNELRGVRLKEPITKDTIHQIENIIKGVENKITILKAKVKIKYPDLFDDDVKDKEETASNEELFLELDNQALQIELGLETGYKINVRTTNVTRWVNLIRVIRDKHERLNK